MEVLVLVCALGVKAPECQPETSINSFYAPGLQTSLVGCVRDGMLYAATSGLVPPDTYAKVVCIARRPANVLVSGER
jgi:hypothetical protein